MAENIHVAIRARPLNAKEEAYGVGWELKESTVTMWDARTQQVHPAIRFTFGAHFLSNYLSCMSTPVPNYKIVFLTPLQVLKISMSLLEETSCREFCAE